MALRRSGLSLATTSTGAVTGNACQLRKVGGATRFSMQITLVGSTKASYRMQGSIDGTNWSNIGSAATTLSSTTAVVSITSTSTIAFTKLRVNQLAMVTKSTKSVKVSVTGY